MHSVKLPKETLEELIIDLKNNGYANIIGLGSIYITKFKKDNPVLAIGSKKNRPLPKRQPFVRIGFRPSFSLKRLFRPK